MRFEQEATVAANQHAVWALYSDVARWPQWADSFTTVQLVDGDLALGARVRIQQPRLPITTWTVTALDPGRGWSWTATGLGTRTVADHRIEQLGPTTTRVRLSVTYGGPIGWIIGRLSAALTRQYLSIEANGLKEACEANA